MTLPDYAALLYGPLYNQFSVAGTIKPPGGTAVGLRVIDKTKGVEISSSSDLHSIKPVAELRVPELLGAGLARGQLRGGTLTMNGKAWRIEDIIPKPSPAGEDEGELRLVLIQTGTLTAAAGQATGASNVTGIRG